MNIKENLQYAYKLLTLIRVSGDDVERMSAVKSVLREIFEGVKSDGGQGGRQNPGSPGD